MNLTPKEQEIRILREITTWNGKEVSPKKLAKLLATLVPEKDLTVQEMMERDIANGTFVPRGRTFEAVARLETIFGPKTEEKTDSKKHIELLEDYYTPPSEEKLNYGPSLVKTEEITQANKAMAPYFKAPSEEKKCCDNCLDYDGGEPLCQNQDCTKCHSTTQEEKKCEKEDDLRYRIMFSLTPPDAWEEEWMKFRTDTVSEMLDDVREDGIFATTRLFKKLDGWLRSRKAEWENTAGIAGYDKGWERARTTTLEEVERVVEEQIIALSHAKSIDEAIEWARFQVAHDTSSANEGAEISSLYRLLTHLKEMRTK